MQLNIIMQAGARARIVINIDKFQTFCLPVNFQAMEIQIQGRPAQRYIAKLYLVARTCLYIAKH